jgi:hypothetical protein
MKTRVFVRAALLGAALLPLGVSFAASHREAPLIAGLPRLDGTDFYMFRSYESGRSAYVTLIANYLPLQDPFGGPNYFDLDDNATYAINIDNQGAGKPDIVYEFNFETVVKNLSVNANGVQTAIPLIQSAPVDPQGATRNVTQQFTLSVVHNGVRQLATNLDDNGKIFWRPLDNIGNKTIPNYEDYASQFIATVALPGCAQPGRVFAGQRHEGFVVNLGPAFDLLNLNPVGPRDGQPNNVSGKNITSLALEVPTVCLTNNGKNPVIGGWTTSSVPNGFGGQKQMSRMGSPLVNELVIGLKDKDTFNASLPANDAQFGHYVTNPSFPVIVNEQFGNAALIPESPRDDLVAIFLTGIKGINQPASVTPSEELRLNTAIAPVAPASQNDLGVLGGDLAGYPNGRRPVDDVVDIVLRAAEGAVCGVAGNCGSQTSDPNHGTPYTDGARAAGADAASSHVTGAIFARDTYLDVFPYLNTPLPGSPNGANGIQ